MALGPQRQIFHRENGMASLRAGECGGILCYVASSGVQVVGYLADISNDVYPLGVQLHDVEVMDEGYIYNPWVERGVRRVSKPNEAVSFSSHCQIDTNFIHPGANPHSGKIAYLAPSGLITDNAGLGGPKIGYFASEINDNKVAGLPNTSGFITVFGGGWVRGQYMKKVNGEGQNIFEIQEPTIEKVVIATRGWCRVRIKI
jgi:hypothetical protein